MRINTRMSSITLRFHKASIKKNLEDWFFIQLTTFTAPYKQTNYSLFLFFKEKPRFVSTHYYDEKDTFSCNCSLRNLLLSSNKLPILGCFFFLLPKCIVHCWASLEQFCSFGLIKFYSQVKFFG